MNSRIDDLHTQFVTESGGSVDSDKLKYSGDKKDLTTSSQRTSNKKSVISELDSVLGDKIPKVIVPDSKKIAAILKEHDPLVLQKHLLATTVQNQVSKTQLDFLSGDKHPIRNHFRTFMVLLMSFRDMMKVLIVSYN